MPAYDNQLRMVLRANALFSLTVFQAGLRKIISRKRVVFIIVQDALWAIVSLLIIVLHAWRLSPEGYWLIGAIALIVMSFGVLQYYFLRQIRS